MLLQTVIGNENWDNGSTKLHLFVCPTGQFPLDAKEDHLWLVCRKGSGGGRPLITQVGSPTVISAGNGLKPEIVGKWTNAVYDIPDGVLLKVMVMRGTPQASRSSNILIRLREGAAMQRIAVTTIPHSRSNLDRLVIEGRFDIFDLDQAAAIGFRPPQMYMPAYLRSRWAQMPYIRVTEIAPETTIAPRVVRQNVQNSDGQTVEVAVTHRPRALDL